MPEMDEAGNAQGMTLVFKTHFFEENGRREIREGAEPLPEASPAFEGRTPRISKQMALAIHLQKLLDDGVVCDCAEIARLADLTRARVTQIMNLNLLAPRIQEEILFLPKIHKGHDPISERDIRPIALKPRWDTQLKLWRTLTQQKLETSDVSQNTGHQHTAVTSCDAPL